MSDSVRPHRRQPIRLPCPWDSPGKNTGVGCHFLLQCMKVKSQSEVVQLCPTLSDSWTAAYQALPSMGFSRQEYWSGVPLPSPSRHLRIEINILYYCTLYSIVQKVHKSTTACRGCTHMMYVRHVNYTYRTGYANICSGL